MKYMKCNENNLSVHYLQLITHFEYFSVFDWSNSKHMLTNNITVPIDTKNRFE